MRESGLHTQIGAVSGNNPAQLSVKVECTEMWILQLNLNTSSENIFSSVFIVNHNDQSFHWLKVNNRPVDSVRVRSVVWRRERVKKLEEGGRLGWHVAELRQRVTDTDWQTTYWCNTPAGSHTDRQESNTDCSLRANQWTPVHRWIESTLWRPYTWVHVNGAAHISTVSIGLPHTWDATC